MLIKIMWIMEWLNNRVADVAAFAESIDWSKVASLFVYDGQNPLMFNTGLFLFLFIGFMWIYRLLAHREALRIGFVILFSLYFYYKSSGLCFLLLVVVALSDYSLGRLLGRLSRKGLRQLCVLASMVVNLGMLCYFKYTNLLLGTFADLTHQPFEPLDIVLPIGISFFTFRSLSYIIDLYRRQMAPVTSFRDYLFYLSFFPPLAAGPVVRAKDFVPQIHRPLDITPALLGEGLFLVMCGLIKKVVISDYISVNFVDRIFDNPMLYTGFENLMGVYGYTLQIYCDFSGYSDMAIGIALLMGYRFKINFDSPYKSGSITEFWRRWHISLSSWLRDYLYISLGGNRRGTVRTYLNLFITMVLGGLWHGASWLFVIWGAWHGLMLIIHKLYRRIFPVAKDYRAGLFRHFLNVLLTFHVVAAGWIFFRAPSLDIAGQILTQIFTNFRPEAIPAFVSGYAVIFVALVAGYLLHFAPHRWSQWLQRELSWSPLVVKAAILALVLFFVLQVRSSELVPFIYSQF